MPRAFTAFVAAIALAGAGACGKTSSSTLAGPSPAKCQLTATNSTPSFSASGGRGTIVVQAARECAWTAAAQASWVALLPPSEGQGDSTLGYTVQANPSGLPRRGMVSVAGQLVEVGQEGAPCRFALDRPRVLIGAAAAAVEVAVQGPSGCAWTATSEAPWITVAQGAQGAGPGQVVISVAQNAGTTRVGAVLIAGNRFEVTQSSTLGPAPPPPGCTYTLLPISARVVAAGGDGSISLTTGGECTWVAMSTEPWLAVTSETSGTGSAQIAYRVTANDTGATRTGMITVGNATFTIEQVAAGAPPPECTFTVTPSDTVTAEAGGSTGTISVATTGSCEWSATASVPWIVLSTSGERGPGQVAYTIEPNPLASERTGTIRVAGTTIAVRQNGTGEGITLSGLAENVAGSCPVLTFTLEGRSVTTSDATAYLGGSCGKLKSGGAIRVRGVLTPEGTVDASEIEFTK